MRHDWTLLCSEVEAQEEGPISLGNVFTTLQVASPFGIVERAASILFDPPAILVSHWTAEFENDKRVHSAIVQLLAPGGEHVLWEDKLQFDVRDTISFYMVYVMPNLEVVGVGV